MKTRLQKWGNSLAVRIPKALVLEAGLDPNGEVDLSLVEGQLLITPAKPRYTLEGLLADVNEQNLHGEIDTGAVVGNEIW